MMKQIIEILNTKKSIYFICLIFIALFFHIFFVEINYIDGDKCAMLLQAADMLKGNLLLDNWYSTEISLGLSELPCFLLAVEIFGISANSIFFATSFSFFLCYLFSFLLIKDNITKLNTLNLIIFITLAGFSNLFVKSSYGHCGSFVCCLIILFFADKYLKTKNNLFLLIFMSVISLFTFADIIIAPVILVPIVICALLKLFYFSEIKSNIKLILFMALGVSVSYCLLKLYLHISSIDNNFSQEHFIMLFTPQIFHYFLLTLREIFVLFGVDNCNRSILDIFAIFSFLRLFIVFVSCYLVVINIKKSLKNENPDFISSAMSFGIVIMILLLILTTHQVDMFSARYLAFIPFFSAVIILRHFSNFENLPKRQFIIIVSYLFLSLITTLYLSDKNPENKYSVNLRKMVMTYLQDNNLHYGVTNEFFNSTSITVLSKNNIKVRAVELNRDNKIVPYEWFSKREWYHEPVEFVIIDTFQNNYKSVLEYYKGKSKCRSNIFTTIILILKDEYVSPVITKNTTDNN